MAQVWRPAPSVAAASREKANVNASLLQLEAIAQFDRYLARTIEVRSAEAVGIVDQVTMVGEIKSRNANRHAFAKAFADAGVKGDMRTEVFGAVAIEES